MTLTEYTIAGRWEPCSQTPEELAERFIRLVDLLAPVHATFSNWLWLYDGKGIPFEQVRADLPSHVAAKVTRNDYDLPEPEMGYWLSICNSYEWTPRTASLQVRGGCSYRFLNSIVFNVGENVAPEPTMVTYPVFKAALLAACECFEVTDCNAFPQGFPGLWNSGHRFRFGWLNYILPRYAPLVTPPQSAIVEYRPNGALFMAATDETFVMSNPQHMAVARDIETALAPLNALPEPF